MDTLLSLAIIARDEERHIGACLESIAGVADEVVVLLDDRTRDSTAVLCNAYGAQVHVERWRGFSAQRNRALDLCRGEWVLFLDADERLTPDLRRELVQLKPALREQARDGTIAGYWIPRHNVFFGKILQGGGWYPDEQLRLLCRTRARYNKEQMVHEVAVLDGASHRLAAHLLHINIERVGEFWLKQTHYALAEARILAGASRQAHWRSFVGAPTREFWRRYVRLGGWHDGATGLFLCLSLAWFEVVKYGCLRLLRSERGSVDDQSLTNN